MDEERYWTDISQAESSGKEFVDICKDCLSFELDNFDRMWKYVFFHDFKKIRQKHGALMASVVLLLICLVRGLSKKFIWHGSFWEGFLYPFFIFLSASLIIVPSYILCRKVPKAGYVITKILLILCFLFLAFIVLLLIYGIVKYVL